MNGWQGKALLRKRSQEGKDDERKTAPLVPVGPWASLVRPAWTVPSVRESVFQLAHDAAYYTTKRGDIEVQFFELLKSLAEDDALWHECLGTNYCKQVAIGNYTSLSAVFDRYDIIKYTEWNATTSCCTLKMQFQGASKIGESNEGS